jgi:1,4-dihydroxy-2-naphthoate octaprenyltransferase
VCLATVPFFLLVFANLLATQRPDREADAAVGKATLVTRLDPATLRALHAATVFASFAALAALAGEVLPPRVALAGGLALPFALWGVATHTRDRNPFPTVAAMVVMAVSQLLAWASLALTVP